MPFFDWDDWPKLGAAMINWCAPHALDSTAIDRTRLPSTVIDLLKELKSASADDLFADFDRGMSVTMDLPDRNAASVRRLSKDDLAKRLAILKSLLRANRPEASDAMAEQLASVENLPCEMRMRLVTALQRCPAPHMAKEGAAAFTSGSSPLFGSAYFLLALSGDETFAAQAVKPAIPTAETAADARDRRRDLAVAISVYPRPGLEAHALRRVEELNAAEAGYYEKLVNLMAPDTAMYETSPCLNADDLLERMGWLGYLARQNPEKYGAQFLREWQRCHLYADYGKRTFLNAIDRIKVKWEELEPFRRNWYDIGYRLDAYSALNFDTAVRVITECPAAGDVLRSARVTSEARAAINALGALPPATLFPSDAPIRHSDLRDFITARR